MENEQLIKEQLAKLPPELQRALELVPWKASVKEIALTNNLSLPQISALDQETMLVLYGFDDPKNYIDNLVSEVGVDENAATTIAEAVNEHIFQPISLKAEELGGNSIHNDLPMVEDGEVAHTVPHDAKLDAMPAAPAGPAKLRPHSDTPVEKSGLKTPDYRYPGGADPYREPLA